MGPIRARGSRAPSVVSSAPRPETSLDLSIPMQRALPAPHPRRIALAWLAGLALWAGLACGGTEARPDPATDPASRAAGDTGDAATEPQGEQPPAVTGAATDAPAVDEPAPAAGVDGATEAADADAAESQAEAAADGRPYGDDSGGRGSTLDAPVEDAATEAVPVVEEEVVEEPVREELVREEPVRAEPVVEEPAHGEGDTQRGATESPAVADEDPAVEDPLFEESETAAPAAEEGAPEDAVRADAEPEGASTDAPASEDAGQGADEARAGDAAGGAPPGGGEPRLGAGSQEGGAGRDVEPTPESSAQVVAQADPRAAAAWRRMLASGRATPEATDQPPPRAFRLQANVVTKDGANTNQLDVDYRYLGPNHVRFLLPSGRETGRGTGRGLSAYWLLDGGEVHRLDTRENKEDRRQVNEMIALARNFLALTDPERIRLTRLELLQGAPFDLPRPVAAGIAREIRRAAEAGQDPAPSVIWIRLSSPDFDLVQRSGEARDARRDQLVSLAIGPEGLPLAAVVQDPSALGRPLTPDAALLSLSRWGVNDGFRVPYRILIYRPEPASPTAGGLAFGADAVQDIALTQVQLRPDFVPTDFDPQQ